MARPSRYEIESSGWRPMTELTRVLREDGTVDVDATLASLRTEHEALLEEMRVRLASIPFSPLPWIWRRSTTEKAMRRALDAQEARFRAFLETGELPL